VFPSVEFRKIWQTGNKYFTLVGALTSFSAALKDNLQKYKKKLPLQTLLFFLFKIRISPVLMHFKRLGRFHRRKFKRITIES